jgi:hypothetical protein
MWRADKSRPGGTPKTGKFSPAPAGPSNEPAHPGLSGAKFGRGPVRLAESRRRRPAPAPGRPSAPIPRRSAPGAPQAGMAARAPPCPSLRHPGGSLSSREESTARQMARSGSRTAATASVGVILLGRRQRASLSPVGQAYAASWRGLAPRRRGGGDVEAVPMRR